MNSEIANRKQNYCIGKFAVRLNFSSLIVSLSMVKIRCDNVRIS